MVENPIVRMFTWWNAAYKSKDGFSPEAFADFYTPAGQLVVNGMLRATGPDELAKHYGAIQDAIENVEMVLPLAEGFHCGNRAFAHVYERVTDAGAKVDREAMCYAVLEGEKIALLRVVANRG